jgi:large subunit ribosomal protein L17
MRHRYSGRQLSRNTGHRKALRKNMASSLFQHGAIRTTAVKAKEFRPFIERLITMAKKGTLHARRRVLAEIGDRAMTDDEGNFLEKSVVQKLFDEIVPSFADRPGGYTRIIHLQERRIGDAGKQVILQLVTASAGGGDGAGAAASRRKRRAQGKAEMAAGKKAGKKAGKAASAPDNVEA